MKITKEDFETWLASPITERVLSVHREKAREARENWNALLDDPAPDDELLKRLPGEYLALLATVQVFEQIGDIRLEDIQEEEDGNTDSGE